MMQRESGVRRRGGVSGPVRVRASAMFILLSGAWALGQAPVDDPVVAQQRWYNRKAERADLIEGAFEVLRFPTGYSPAPRYRRDPKQRGRLLNADFRCTRCLREKRVPAETIPSAGRLMERDAGEVVSWLREQKGGGSVTFIEDGIFKLLTDLPSVNLKEARNPHLKEELVELGAIFPKVTEKTVVLNGHQRAHLYLIRAHRILRDFYWMVGHGEGNKSITEAYPHLGKYLGMKGKLECYLFEKERRYSAFTKRYIGRAASDGQCWHLFRDRAMILTMHGSNHRDLQVQGHFSHKLMHNLLDSYRMYSFKLPAWFQMGMAHWVERRESARYNSFCYSEGSIPRVLHRTRWAPRIKRMVARDRVPPFVQACATKEYGDFEPELHMITYSWVCYLWRLGPEKMSVFINELKSKKQNETLYQVQIRAFRAAYGITLLQFDAGWRAWVKAVYPDR